MDEIERFQHAGRTVVLSYDREPTDPREYENLSILLCWHRNWKLGDVNTGFAYSEEEIRERAGEEVLALLPLYLYDHGGITMNTVGFSDRWDSGQVGWGYITKSSAKKMGCELWIKDQLEKTIREEVEEYDKFLQGEAYGYQILGIDEAILDDCWGFNDLEDCRNQAKYAAEHTEDPAVQEMAEELAGRATFAG